MLGCFEGADNRGVVADDKGILKIGQSYKGKNDNCYDVEEIVSGPANMNIDDFLSLSVLDNDCICPTDYPFDA